jgi:RimJ/RimL family protein N-acetyltransferase
MGIQFKSSSRGGGRYLPRGSSAYVVRGLALRASVDADVPYFFAFQSDPEARHMAAFTNKLPNDRKAFEERWERIRQNPANQMRTVLLDDRIVGQVMKYEFEGQPEVSYWIDRPFWGQGIATEALLEYLREFRPRPVGARVSKDNVASRRVLEKCGFKIVGEGKGFASARDAEIEEYVLRLD